MSIKFKVAAILAVLFTGLLVLNAAVLLLVVLPSYRDLDRREAEQDMQRVVDVLRSDVEDLDLLAFDWAAWDDTHAFVVEGNPSYVESNLIAETFVGTGLNLLFIVDLAGRVAWGRAFDQESGEFVTLAEFPEDGLPPGHPLLAHPDPDSAIAGLMATERGPMMVSSRPIITSRKSGPVRGALIMGRLFDAAAVADLAERVHVSLEALKPGADGGPDPLPGELRVAEGEGGLKVYAAIPDITGAPLLLLRSHHAKDITGQGETTIFSALALMAVFAAATLWAVLYLLQEMIISPLSAMTRHVVRLGKTGALSENLPEGRNDELGLVARAFNRMQDRITHLAHHDSLTALPNRTLFNDRVEQILKLARRQKVKATVFFLDLDAFKVVNDTLGHHVGDLLLRAVAERLETGLRECDTISRMGGDEFTIVAYGMPGDDEAEVIGDKIIGLFVDPFEVEDRMLNITTSVGISLFPDHGEDAETLLRNADIAMYRAKTMGRNNCQLFVPGKPLQDG